MKPKTAPTNEKMLVLAVVISMFVWGCSWPSSKILMGYGSPQSIALLRFIVVFFSLLIVLIALRIPLSISRGGWLTMLLAGITLALYNYLFLKGLQYGYAGAGGVMVSTLNPIFSFVIGIVISKRRLLRNEVSGLVFGLLAGFFLLELHSGSPDLLVSGNIYFLAAAFVWALMSKITSRSGLFGAPLGFSLWVYLITLFTMAVFTDLTEAFRIVETSDLRFWNNMFVFAVLATTVATTLYFFATSKLGAEKASSFIFLVPLSAALSSWVILQETIEWHTIVGGIFGVLAVVLINRQSVKIPVATE